ncbi:hypothetical protein ACFWDG_24715 [Peribacillus sp. NPDC060186]
MQSAFNKENTYSTLPFNFIVNDWIIYDCMDFIGNKTIRALHKDEENKPRAAKTVAGSTPKIDTNGQYVMETFDSMQVTNKVQDTLVFSKDVWIVS